jgi:hypothetical protein
MWVLASLLPLKARIRRCLSIPSVHCKWIRISWEEFRSCLIWDSFYLTFIIQYSWFYILLTVHHSVYQYNETNVMNFSFNLLRIKSLYMFRALLAHPQETLHKRHLVYCVHVISVGCGTIAVSQLTLNARNIPSAVCEAPPEDEKVMIETCRGSWFSINWMKSALRWFHYTDTEVLFILYRKLQTVSFSLLWHLIGIIQTCNKVLAYGYGN